jgi:predicted Zn-dependent protease
MLKEASMNVQPGTTGRVRRAPRVRALALVAALAAPPALAGCASAGPNKGQLNLVSMQEEWQLGQQLHRDISRQMPVDQDRQAVEYVNLIGQRLARTTYYRELPWNFHVVDDPAINAFNIPGGHIYVNTGLIRATDNAAELASVIGHELSHGLARHGTENLTKQYGFGIVASLVLGNNPPLYQQLLAQVLGTGVFAKYSRDAEREADRLGIQAMYDAGYDPHGAVTMFQELLAARKSSPSGLEKFFGSHPITEERISNARAQIAALPPKPNLIVDDGRFDQVKARLAAR